MDDSTAVGAPPPAHSDGPPRVELVGRSTSHFTRVATIFAHELGVPFELSIVRDLTSLDAPVYAGHPALKIPLLRVGESVVFGTENICRKLTELAGRAGDPRLIFPEHVTADAGRCAQELVWNAMATQVQLVVGTRLAGLPTDNVFFAKATLGLRGALLWLEERLGTVLPLLPAPRDLSIFEVTLFCLIEHLSFRPTVSIEPYATLRSFASTFAARVSAQRTPFRVDPEPFEPKEP
jgi:glutathione S-transferase